MPTKAELEAKIESWESVRALQSIKAVYIGEETCSVTECQSEEVVYHIKAPNGTVTSLCDEHTMNLQCFLQGFGVKMEL